MSADPLERNLEAKPARSGRAIPERFTSRPLAAVRFVAQRMLLKPLVWSLTTVTVIGRERVSDLRGAFVVVANHTSHLDAPLVMGALPRRLARYIAAGAAGDYFFDVRWRRGLTALFFNAFRVDRGARVEPGGREPARGVNARALLDGGVPVLIFPEGTRSHTGDIGTFKPGAAALVSACGVPCVPAALIGVHSAHPRGTNWPKPGRLPVGVVFGEPVRPAAGESAVDFTARLRSEIVRLHDAHSARILGPNEGAHP